MKSNRLRPLVVIIALMALSLGLLGAHGVANAAGLTKKQVRSIASTIVKKKAKKLTVKNARNLAGKPASAYTENAFTFSAEVSTPVERAKVILPLAPGRYYVAYSAYLETNGGGQYACYLRNSNGTASDTFLADDMSIADLEPYAAVSGSGFVNVAPADEISLECSDIHTPRGLFIAGGSDPIQVIAIALDSATSTALPIEADPRPRR